MRINIFQVLLGVIALVALSISTIVFCFPLFLLVFLKWIVPIKSWRKLCTHGINACATGWVTTNNIGIKILFNPNIEIIGMPKLDRYQSYMLIANHQSWTDIILLQKVFLRKIPFLKFFIKDQLKWVPILGLAWWGMDFPFMKRFSKAQLAKNPKLKGKDLLATQRACERATDLPAVFTNFLEGTRFTIAKRDAQQSPFRNLLKPRAGGIAYVLKAMGDRVKNIVDVTIVYPGGAKTLWQFLCGKVKHIQVYVRLIPLDKSLIGDYENDPAFQEHFRTWLNKLWQEKQQIIDGATSTESILQHQALIR